MKIICEIASAHCGDVTKLKKLLKAAEKTNSDFIKLQIFNLESLASKNNSNYNDLKKIQISREKWCEILTFYNKNIKTDLIVEVYDVESLSLIKNFDYISGIKIPTSDTANLDFISEACSFMKKIFLGVGGSNLDEINSAVNVIKKHKVRPVIMHGIQSYPTLIESCNFHKINVLINKYKCEVGFADHVNADEKLLSIIIPAMAYSAGATYIEKHITLDRSLKEFDYQSALNPDEFIEFVKILKGLESSININNNSLDLDDNELKYRALMKKFAVADENIKSGTIFKNVRLKYLRENGGITYTEAVKYSNYIFIKDVVSGNVILKDDLREMQ